ncbi:choice-of-anchor I family protein [Mangrovimicrobium sediminis]|nr:choice-of-anchor I family protein [Haliea sp. SAOS-164]
MGNEPGDNLSEDWFEIVNLGDTAWVAGVDAPLFYDDDSQDAGAADRITGLVDIQPGEAVIVLVTDDPSAVDAFGDLWSPVYNLDGVEIGLTDGSGLGQGGDGVTLFLGGPDAVSIVDFEEYPEADAFGGQSWNVFKAGFSEPGDLPDEAVATAAVNDAAQPAVGSPGNGGPAEIVGNLPEITLLGDNPLVVSLGTPFADPGASAFDAEDGDLSGAIVVAGDVVDTATLGEYSVTYDVTDTDSNAAATVTRTVVVTYAELIPAVAPPATTGLFRHVATLGGLPGAEIPAYDSISQQVYVTSGDGLQVVDFSDPLNPVPGMLIDPASAPFNLSSAAVTSVDSCGGLVAFSVPADPQTDPGSVILVDSAGTLVDLFTVGALPDMLTFTADCGTILTANEGEPDDGIDPEGSISIIDVASGVVETAGFGAFNGQEALLRAAGVRLFPEVLVANDLEPEYIALSKNRRYAYVTLQEANSLAVVDIRSATVTEILPLGLKDHSLPGNALDASDRDSVINIRNWPLYGMYMPDAIAGYRVGGKQYFITANEGDARNADERVSSLPLDPVAFPDAAALQGDFDMGRIQVSAIDGDPDMDGDYDALQSYGARSFSIWDEEGTLVYDSGSDIEAIVATYSDAYDDGRSDNKGPEPEGVEIGRVGKRSFAFIGLERTDQVLVFDVSEPSAPVFMQLLENAGDEAPEGLHFIARRDSPNRCPTLLVTNEDSNTLTVYQYGACRLFN